VSVEQTLAELSVLTGLTFEAGLQG